MSMKEEEIPRLGKITIEPDKIAILEINEALKDKSGRKALHIIWDIIYGKENHEWRKKIRRAMR